MNPDEVEDIILSERFDFTCPFCKQPAATGLLEKGPQGTTLGAEVVTHGFPMCPEYLSSDPLVYLGMCLAKMREGVVRA